MKTLITFFLIAISCAAYAQNYQFYNINFEDNSQLFRLQIDTLSNQNNIWKIGKPQKTVFTSAFSNPNVIITDTVNPYPTNDTSIFVIKHMAGQGYQQAHTVILSGKYFVNSDTITDFGKIEFSADNGISWINILDSILYDTANNIYWYWNFNRPVLTGNSGGWKNFWVNIAFLGYSYGLQFYDTVYYRFTFISDSIQTNKDGLMYDNLHFEDWAEGIEELQNQFESKIFPNPTTGKIEIKFENDRNDTFEFLIYDIDGKSILLDESTKNSSIKVDLKSYISGIYVYKLINLQNNIISTGKIIKE